MTTIKCDPMVICHPGIILEEKLEELGMSKKEFALRIRKPLKTVHGVISGKSSITHEMAELFESVLNIPAHFWNNAQLNYDEYNAHKIKVKNISDSINWMKKFCIIPDMIKRGWLPPVKTPYDRTVALLAFFGFATHEGWTKYFEERQLSTVFRISLKKSPDPYALSVWLRHGEIESAKIQLNNEYSSDKLKRVLPDMLKLVHKEPHNIFESLKELCSSCGIILVYTPHLTNTQASGATRWINGRPLVQVSDRCKRYDIFCFSFFHELGHILLHGKKDIFIEGVDYGAKDKQKEAQADDFASNILFSNELEKKFLSEKITEINIKSFAKQNSIHPSIIIGRLHHKKIIHESHFSKLIPHIKF